MRNRFLAAAALGLACAATMTSAASGNGGPPTGVIHGWNGIEAGSERYVTVGAPGWTVVQAISRNGGRVLRFTTLKGAWGVPTVANDGTTDGLLSDGRRLMLAQADVGAHLRKHSAFSLFDMKKMRELDRVRIPGHHTFDAISPEGRYLYTIEYVSKTDYARYRVRAYDMHARHLLKKPVNDSKREEIATMQGSPVSRATSPDRGWVYTLYGGSGHAFIHALNTRRVKAVCIDMPWHKEPKKLFQSRLRLDGEGQLVVRGPRGRALVAIDRRSHKIVSSVRNP
jgi:hypothetical protein